MFHIRHLGAVVTVPPVVLALLQLVGFALAWAIGHSIQWELWVWGVGSTAFFGWLMVLVVYPDRVNEMLLRPMSAWANNAFTTAVEKGFNFLVWLVDKLTGW